MKVLILSFVLVGLASGQMRDPGCPKVDNIRSPTHLPHPTDCGRFLKCHNGIAHEIPCPSGQHWNVQRNVCDSVVNARCETVRIQPPRPQPPRPTQPWVQPPRTILPWQPTQQFPQQPERNPRPDIEHPDYLDCPPNDIPGRIVYFPYHMTCQHFYQCINGRAVL